MISRPDPRRQGGFTLLEVLAVLAILGLASALVIARGPARPRVMDLRATAGELADIMRLARAHAIATNRSTHVVIDNAAHAVQGPGHPPLHIPAAIGIALHTLTGPTQRPRLAIRFAPDGSSSGGAVELSAGARRLRVDAGWLTGQVRLTDVP
jgi:general secretion pathway protein H